MSKRTIVIVIGIIVILVILILLISGSVSKLNGTPIIIKGGGVPDGLLVSIEGEGLTPDNPSGQGEITSIRVITDKDCLFYDLPSDSVPTINLSTDPKDCNIKVNDKAGSSAMPLKFDSDVLKWKNGKFEARTCKMSSLEIAYPFWSKEATCTTLGNVSKPCLKAFKLTNVSKLEVRINYTDKCPSSTTTPTP